MSASDPISGAWSAGPIVMFLKYNGAGELAGQLTAGGVKTVGEFQSGTFDAATGALRFEGDLTDPRDNSVKHFRVEGTLDGNRMRVTYHVGDTTGDSAFTRITLGTMAEAVVRDVQRVFESIVGGLARRVFRAAYPRRTREQNLQLMRERGEDPASFVVREVREDEIDELARLHVVTWAATYPEVLSPPTFAIRSWQWRDAFAKQDGHWFCYVVVNGAGKLVGFTRGIRNKQKRHEGDLNKIYLLSEYQRLRLGRRMLAAVTERFLAMGVTRMTVNAEADNPSCRFYEATGAVNTIDEKTGRPNGGSYVWNNLEELRLHLQTVAAR